MALIAAALTLVFAVGGFASGLFNLKDGTTYAELADSSAVIESAVIAVPADNNESEPETAIEIEYRRIYVTNLQGDIIGIADNTKTWEVRYRYWN